LVKIKANLESKTDVGDMFKFKGNNSAFH